MLDRKAVKVYCKEDSYTIGEYDCTDNINGTLEALSDESATVEDEDGYLNKGCGYNL